MSSHFRAEDVIAAARACLGTPFRHQGRQPGVGLDCAGLVVSVCRALNIPYQDAAAYGRRPHDGLLESTLSVQPAMYCVPRHAMQPADVLLMRFRTDPQHLAIYAEPTVIHSYETVGQVVEHCLDNRWAARIVRVYRFSGVNT